MFSKLKQFKDLREQGKKLQGALEGESVTVKTLGDQITLTIDGNLGITNLIIDPATLSPDKKVKLENAIKDAHKDAMKKMQRIIAGKMQEMGGLPGMK